MQGATAPGEGSVLHKKSVVKTGKNAEKVEGVLRAYLHRTGLRVRELFRYMDTDESGSIDRRKLQAAVSKLSNGNVASTEVDRFFSAVDVKGKGVLEFDEVAIAPQLSCDARTSCWLLHAAKLVEPL